MIRQWCIVSKKLFGQLQLRPEAYCIKNYCYRSHLDDIGFDTMDYEYNRVVPRTMEEMGDVMSSSVASPVDSHLLKVAVIGLPNSGKSTLINKLMGWRVCTVSKKVHTTQCGMRAVFSKGNTQIVFLDTPGLVNHAESIKHNLKRSLVVDGEKSLLSADLIAVVHDLSNKYLQRTLHPQVLRLLTLYPHIPSVLVLNKVDTVKTKRHLLEIARILSDGTVGGRKSHPVTEEEPVLTGKQLINRALGLKSKDEKDPAVPELCSAERRTKNVLNFSFEDVLEGKYKPTEIEVMQLVEKRNSWPKFEDVFMVSAHDGLGVEDLLEYMIAWAYPANWLFSQKVVTDQNPYEIAMLAVREKFLDYFPKEVPYNLQYDVEFWEVSEAEVLNIVIGVRCKKRRLIQVLIGSGGKSVSRIAKEAEQDLRDTFRSEVRLRLNVSYNKSFKK
ncbi:GTPase Era, mitochondrial [Oratosquilla oratoria]|uniref:GTPase Era, mitochondrial n=1 Tax=Oratosquilla oratoria TaxID=337810 RepID=UPI003F76A028